MSDRHRRKRWLRIGLAVWLASAACACSATPVRQGTAWHTPGPATATPTPDGSPTAATLTPTP